MKTELFMDLCFIRQRDQRTSFAEMVEHELESVFGNEASWYLETKQDNQLEIVLVEVNGIGNWTTEDALIADVEQKASDRFMSWLQGYRLSLDVKEEHAGCANCGQRQNKREVI